MSEGKTKVTNGIKLENISFSYNNSAPGAGPVFRELSLEFPASGVSVILGPSGCGKTTLLNLISGLLGPESGRIVMRGNGNGNDVPMSVLFQEPRLLPWRTISQNIEIVLNSHCCRRESRKKAEHYLNLVGLGDYYGYFPAQLSGGMRQRAAMARAFAFPAEIILMDEPFQALDLGLKINLIKLFTDLWSKDRRTAILVTHDINEAVMLGDEIFVLAQGKPTFITEHMINTLPFDRRRLDSPECLEIEAKLYRLLTEGGTTRKDR